jgi:hypothetical protein
MERQATSFAAPPRYSFGHSKLGRPHAIVVWRARCDGPGEPNAMDVLSRRTRASRNGRAARLRSAGTFVDGCCEWRFSGAEHCFIVGNAAVVVPDPRPIASFDFGLTALG